MQLYIFGLLYRLRVDYSTEYEPKRVSDVFARFRHAKNQHYGESKAKFTKLYGNEKK